MNQQNQNPQFTIEAPERELSAIESISRAEVDSQISTAKKYPRQLSVVKQKMLSFATLDQETAAGCFYTLPGRRGGDGKAIQGPSIRMAEIAISTYQNLRAGARIIADDGKIITAQGVCHDLENNVCVMVETKRRVTTKDGNRYSDDMVVTTGNAACSIALRNATFRVVPLALVKPIYEAAKKVAIGDAKTLVSRRADAMAHFTKMGIAKERIFAAVGAKALDDIGLEQLENLIGYANAIRDGETSIDEAFPEPEKKPSFTPAEKPQEPTNPPAPPVSSPASEPDPQKPVETTAKAPKSPRGPAASAQSVLEGVITSAGFTFDDCRTVLGGLGLIENADSYASFSDLPEAACKTAIFGKASVIAKLKEMKGV